MIRRGLAAGMVLTFLLVGGSASAAQMDARNAPSTSGPVDLLSRRCASTVETHEGEVIATAESCLYFHTLDPLKETDEERDFGVIWLQTTVNARRGWCTSEVTSDINLPGGVTVHSSTPHSRSVGRVRAMTSEIVADAQGKARRAGVVKKSFTLYPRGIEAYFNNARSRYRVRWNGSTKEKLGFASGLELSWPRRDPPLSFSSSLTYQFRKSRTC